jgi:hypothetical protein
MGIKSRQIISSWVLTAEACDHEARVGSDLMFERRYDDGSGCCEFFCLCEEI